MTTNQLLEALLNKIPIYTSSGVEVKVVNIDFDGLTVWGNGYRHYIGDLTLVNRLRYKTVGLYDLVFDADRNLMAIDTGPNGELSKFSPWVMDDTDTVPFNTNLYDLRDFKKLFRAMAQTIGGTL